MTFNSWDTFNWHYVIWLSECSQWSLVDIFCDNCRGATRKHCVLLFKYEHVGLLRIHAICCCTRLQCVHRERGKGSHRKQKEKKCWKNCCRHLWEQPLDICKFAVNFTCRLQVDQNHFNTFVFTEFNNVVRKMQVSM